MRIVKPQPLFMSDTVGAGVGIIQTDLAVEPAAAVAAITNSAGEYRGNGEVADQPDTTAERLHRYKFDPKLVFGHDESASMRMGFDQRDDWYFVGPANYLAAFWLSRTFATKSATDFYFEIEALEDFDTLAVMGMDVISATATITNPDTTVIYSGSIGGRDHSPRITPHDYTFTEWVTNSKGFVQGLSGRAGATIRLDFTGIDICVRNIVIGQSRVIGKTANRARQRTQYVSEPFEDAWGDRMLDLSQTFRSQQWLVYVQANWDDLADYLDDIYETTPALVIAGDGWEAAKSLAYLQDIDFTLPDNSALRRDANGKVIGGHAELNLAVETI